jgi:hypothetical protein
MKAESDGTKTAVCTDSHTPTDFNVTNSSLITPTKSTIVIHNVYLLRLSYVFRCRLRLKRDGTGAETTFRLSPKRTSPFKSAEASVQSTAGSRGVSISGGNAGYTMFRGSVKSTGYPLHSPVSPSLPLPCVTLCHHISTGLYHTPSSGGLKFPLPKPTCCSTAFV